jgi:hypothetical protein
MPHFLVQHRAEDDLTAHRRLPWKTLNAFVVAILFLPVALWYYLK